MSIGGKFDCYPPKTNQNEEYRQGYRDGYRDGMKDSAKKDPDPIYPRQPSWPNTPRNGGIKCSKCGIDMTGFMGYVCNDINCPTYPRVTFG